LIYEAKQNTFFICYLAFLLSFLLKALGSGEFAPQELSKMFASHATTMANALGTPIIVFTQTGSMAVLLSHFRPSCTIFAFTNQWVSNENLKKMIFKQATNTWFRPCRERIKQRLVLYQGVVPVQMDFSNDAEETFSRAIEALMVLDTHICIFHIFRYYK
jgi:pyruvate kinase